MKCMTSLAQPMVTERLAKKIILFDIYTPMTYNSFMVIIETTTFTKLITALMNDDNYRELQEILIRYPASGDLIKGSGGLRKIRWKMKGSGKRGGVRVIYYWAIPDKQLRLFYVYPKGKQDDITQAQLKALRQVIERWADE